MFDNFERVLKANKLGVVFNNLHQPLEMMQRVQQLGNIPNEQAYLYWNMGNGMLLTCQPQHANAIVNMATTQNYNAQIAGEIIQGQKIEQKSEQISEQKSEQISEQNFKACHQQVLFLRAKIRAKKRAKIRAKKRAKIRAKFRAKI